MLPSNIIATRRLWDPAAYHMYAQPAVSVCVLASPNTRARLAASGSDNTSMFFDLSSGSNNSAPKTTLFFPLFKIMQQATGDRCIRTGRHRNSFVQYKVYSSGYILRDNNDPSLAPLNCNAPSLTELPDWQRKQDYDKLPFSFRPVPVAQMTVFQGDARVQSVELLARSNDTTTPGPVHCSVTVANDDSYRSASWAASSDIVIAEVPDLLRAASTATPECLQSATATVATLFPHASNIFVFDATNTAASQQALTEVQQRSIDHVNNNSSRIRVVVPTTTSSTDNNAPLIISPRMIAEAAWRILQQRATLNCSPRLAAALFDSPVAVSSSSSSNEEEAPTSYADSPRRYVWGGDPAKSPYVHLASVRRVNPNRVNARSRKPPQSVMDAIPPQDSFPVSLFVFYNMIHGALCLVQEGFVYLHQRFVMVSGNSRTTASGEAHLYTVDALRSVTPQGGPGSALLQAGAGQTVIVQFGAVNGGGSPDIQSTVVGFDSSSRFVMNNNNAMRLQCSPTTDRQASPRSVAAYIVSVDFPPELQVAARSSSSSLATGAAGAIATAAVSAVSSIFASAAAAFSSSPAASSASSSAFSATTAATTSAAYEAKMLKLRQFYRKHVDGSAAADSQQQPQQQKLPVVDSCFSVPHGAIINTRGSGTPAHILVETSSASSSSTTTTTATLFFLCNGTVAPSPHQHVPLTVIYPPSGVAGSAAPVICFDLEGERFVARVRNAVTAQDMVADFLCPSNSKSTSMRPSSSLFFGFWSPLTTALCQYFEQSTPIIPPTLNPNLDNDDKTASISSGDVQFRHNVWGQLKIEFPNTRSSLGYTVALRRIAAFAAVMLVGSDKREDAQLRSMLEQAAVKSNRVPPTVAKHVLQLTQALLNRLVFSDGLALRGGAKQLPSVFDVCCLRPFVHTGGKHDIIRGDNDGGGDGNDDVPSPFRRVLLNASRAARLGELAVLRSPMSAHGSLHRSLFTCKPLTASISAEVVSRLPVAVFETSDSLAFSCIANNNVAGSPTNSLLAQATSNSNLPLALACVRALSRAVLLSPSSSSSTSSGNNQRTSEPSEQLIPAAGVSVNDGTWVPALKAINSAIEATMPAALLRSPFASHTPLAVAAPKLLHHLLLSAARISMAATNCNAKDAASAPPLHKWIEPASLASPSMRLAMGQILRKYTQVMSYDFAAAVATAYNWSNDPAAPAPPPKLKMLSAPLTATYFEVFKVLIRCDLPMSSVQLVATFLMVPT